MIGTNFSYNTSRALVVQLGVNVEEAVSIFLCGILEIDISKSAAFGTSSFALSFNNKVTLLTDLNLLGKTEKRYFDIFMQIRNKFAHVKSVDSFISCDKHMGKDSPFKFLKKMIEITEEDEEKYLEYLFRQLYVKLQTELLKLLLKTQESANARRQQKRDQGLMQKVIRMAREITIQKKQASNTRASQDELIKILYDHSQKLSKNEEQEYFSDFIKNYPSLWETLSEC